MPHDLQNLPVLYPKIQSVEKRLRNNGIKLQACICYRVGKNYTIYNKDYAT